METELPNDYKEFIELLQSNKVRYLLIGGLAVSLHGYPRSTYDLDLFVGSDPENVGRLRTALTRFGFAEIDVSPETFAAGKKLIELGAEPVKIEILNFASGLDFEKAYENRTTGILDGIEVSLIGLEDLKTNKKASGRHKDLDDLEHLDAIP
jgi:hypothetical protein